MNFCELSDDKLGFLFDYLGIKEVYDNSEEVSTIKSGVVLERRWEWYDAIIVTPSKIRYSHDPYPSTTIFDKESFNDMVKVVEKLS
jgi:hypothetical protein